MHRRRQDCGRAAFPEHKRDPQPAHQVHYPEDAIDPGPGGIRSPGTHVVELIALRAPSEFALNGDALAVLLAIRLGRSPKQAYRQTGCHTA